MSPAQFIPWFFFFERAQLTYRWSPIFFERAQLTYRWSPIFSLRVSKRHEKVKWQWTAYFKSIWASMNIYNLNYSNLNGGEIQIDSLISDKSPNQGYSDLSNANLFLSILPQIIVFEDLKQKTQKPCSKSMYERKKLFYILCSFFT